MVTESAGWHTALKQRPPHGAKYLEYGKWGWAEAQALPAALNRVFVAEHLVVVAPTAIHIHQRRSVATAPHHVVIAVALQAVAADAADVADDGAVW